MENKNLTRIFDSGCTEDPFDEIVYLIKQTDKEIDLEFIQQVHADISSMFAGSYPGYKRNTHRYHDLPHTYGVVLATIRLFHGLKCDGHETSTTIIQKALLSAYFHDSGLLLQATDSEDSGANYTRYHESRSIQCLHNYFQEKEITESFCHDCATIILFTNINLDPQTLATISKEAVFAGKVVGSADLMAQMADRYYLESLPLLFEEQQAAGISENKTARDLILNTVKFYQEVIQSRLKITFDNVSKHLRSHFNNRYQIDQNLYQENINKNIEYLETVVKDCQGDSTCMQNRLRRKLPKHSNN